MQVKTIEIDNPGLRRVAVIGGTFSGNRGASAMLESVIHNLRFLLGNNVTIDVISVYPARDRKYPLPDGVRLVPAPPIALILVLPAMAACYAILRRLGLPTGPLRKWPLLDSVARSDAILDIEGISFVDGRPMALLYNIACSLPGIICRTPVIRLSQTIGPLRSALNRTAARLILRRCRMLFARGQETERELTEAGISGFRPAADLAFILQDHLPASDPVSLDLPGDGGPVIGVAPSQVLSESLGGTGIDLAYLLAGVLDEAIEATGGRVVIIAHSWLGPEKRSRNNDYHICSDVLRKMRRKERAVFLERDLSASQLRDVISRFDCFVACRFHAMISALCVGTPCAVPAWSHKYREVMDRFGLGEYVIERSDLGAARLLDSILALLENRDAVSGGMGTPLATMRRSAWSQLELTAGFLREAGIRVKTGGTAGRLYREIYRDQMLGAWLGHAADSDLRKGAASGGLVSALLIDLLESGAVDGVIAARICGGGHGPAPETVLCRTSEEILDCRTSIYSDFNHAAGIIRILRDTPGRYAAVALPCQWTWIDRWLERVGRPRAELALRVGLWCGHATGRSLIGDFLSLNGIGPGDIERLWYRRGLWRGYTEIAMKDGATRRMPFGRGYGLLQNLYADCKVRCFSCEDHFAADSDISFGDAWLPEMKERPVKHSMAVAMTRKGLEAGGRLVSSPSVRMAEIPPELAVRAQKRAVIWHTYGTAGRERICRRFGIAVKGSGRFRARWNDLVSAFLILVSWKAFSGRARRSLMRMPWPLRYAGMLVQKFFLNF